MKFKETEDRSIMLYFETFKWIIAVNAPTYLLSFFLYWLFNGVYTFYERLLLFI